MIDLIVKTASELLQKGEYFVIASIVNHKGSTPRIAGTRMIVTADGKGVGTIGGGLPEARVMEKAKKIISREVPPTFLSFDLTHEDTSSMDMICGGKTTVLLNRIVPSQENLNVFEKWKQTLEKRKNGYFLTVVSGSEQKIDSISHCVIDAEDNVYGAVPLAADALAIIKSQARKSQFKCVPMVNTVVIVEPASRPKTVYFFGAGHVAQPTVHLACMTGFQTVVLDDRADFANQARFPEANEIHVLENFEKACKDISVDAESFIVIFTRGHLHDRTVLAQALKTDATYIGMIGSRKKRDAIYKALMNSGFKQEDINRVHSPIGLAIGAETPEEIAVSIVAELIACRAKKMINES